MRLPDSRLNRVMVNPSSPAGILSKRSNRKTESGITRKTVRLSGRYKSRVESGAVLMIAPAVRMVSPLSDCQFPSMEHVAEPWTARTEARAG
jgi:hypothetical protein